MGTQRESPTTLGATHSRCVVSRRAWSAFSLLQLRCFLPRKRKKVRTSLAPSPTRGHRSPSAFARYMQWSLMASTRALSRSLSSLELAVRSPDDCATRALWTLKNSRSLSQAKLAKIRGVALARARALGCRGDRKDWYALGVRAPRDRRHYSTVDKRVGVSRRSLPATSCARSSRSKTRREFHSQWRPRATSGVAWAVRRFV